MLKGIICPFFMIFNTAKILTELKTLTNKVILFHSGTGKDSIVLADLLYKHGIEYQPVFMYIVKGLEFENSYINWSEKKYGTKFIQLPHYALASYIYSGTFGITQDKSIKKITFKDVNNIAINKTGIDWTVIGSKKQDALERRIMLNELNLSAFQYNTNKCYPLADWLNRECLAYIEKNKLIKPVAFCKSQSQALKINDKNSLLGLKRKYPNDLKKIVEQFPELEALIYCYENE